MVELNGNVPLIKCHSDMVMLDSFLAFCMSKQRDGRLLILLDSFLAFCMSKQRDGRLLIREVIQY